MALRRMFAKSVIRSSHFMRMPINTQFLYLQMLLDADDDGFISNPELEVTIAHCSQDDLKNLIDRHYVMMFPSGIALIRHWFLHNFGGFCSNRAKAGFQRLSSPVSSSWRARPAMRLISRSTWVFSTWPDPSNFSFSCSRE